MRLAIALPIFDRIEFVRRTLPALFQVRGIEHVPIFAGYDGPRETAWYEGGNIEATRKYAQAMLGNHAAEVQHALREKNIGMSDNIMDTVARAFRVLGADAVIVLEDDVLVGKDFLAFIRRCLERYSTNQDVIGVTASCEFCERETSPYRGSPLHVRSSAWWVSIGWATWRDRWTKLYEAYQNWKRDRLAWTVDAWQKISATYGFPVRAHLARLLFHFDDDPLTPNRIDNERWGGVFNIHRAVERKVIVAPWAARATHIGWYGQNMRQNQAAEWKSTPENPIRMSKCFAQDWETEKLNLTFAEAEEIRHRCIYQGFA